MTSMKSTSLPPCQVQASGAIELLFYGELVGAERHDVESHLASCAECRSALEELRAIRSALAERPRIEGPPAGDWASLMSRIDAAIGTEPRPQPSSSRLLLADAGKGPLASSRRHPIPAYLALAAMLTLVTASITYLARQQMPRPAAPAASASIEAPVPGESHAPAPALAPAATAEVDPFAVVSEQHFERSKLVILGLASRDPHSSSSSDWEYERQLAGSLLDDTRLYKQVAEARGLDSLAGVMSDLELVLLQASLSDHQDAATLDRLQRLIRKRDLVSKMEMTRF